MRSVGRGALALFVVAVVLAGGLYGVAGTRPATADAPPLDRHFGPHEPAERPTASVAPSGGASDATGEPRKAATAPDREDIQWEPGLTTGTSGDASTALDRGATAIGQEGAGQSRPDVLLTQRFSRLPERPGYVEVTYNYTLSDPIVGLRTVVPARGNVTGTDGFVAVNETIYAWDGGTVDPTVTYRLPVNETGVGDHVASNGSLLFADVGEWSLFRRPGTSTSWEARSRDPIVYDRRTVTDGPGAAGEWLVYLGEGRMVTRRAANQTFRLVVPRAANMSESPDDVLDAMERASVELDVGERDESVFTVAAPTDGVSWSVRGLSVEGSDLWVGDRERLDNTENIWVHEYVHTRQDYEPTAATRWTREGFATYYAARQALLHQDVDFAEFAAALDRSGAESDGSLSDPGTWTNRTDYDRGALVAGQLDRLIRAGSDGERSLDAVLAGMNDDPNHVNASEFYALVDRASDGAMDRTDRLDVATETPVPMWNRTQHVRAFGGMPPRIQAGLPADLTGAYRLEGPYRNESIEGLPPTLVTGETLVVDGHVRNVGGSRGHYDVDLEVDGELVDTADGMVPSGTSREVPLSYTFDSAGQYTIGVGNDTATVRVLQPASATLAGFNVSRTALEQYGSATVNLTVRNDLSIPAERTVTVRRDGEAVANRSVYVGPNATATAAVQVAFPTNGTSSVSVGDLESVPVTVQQRDRPGGSMVTPQATTAAPTGPSSALGTGLGVVTALLALVATMLAVRHRF